MRISIVTPTFNQDVYLRQTADSVLSQHGNFELEWLVIDGGSSDRTVEILRRTTDPRLRWTSEKDRGQSHAINNGLAQATGDIVAWLNGDDLYEPGALQKVVSAFEDEKVQWLVGDCRVIDAAGAVIRRSVSRYKTRLLTRYSYRSLLRENFISQPSVFWRRDFGRQLGPLDESLHWTMDYDLWLRMGKQADPLILPQTLSSFRLHAASKSGRVERQQFDEQFAVARRYFDGDRVSAALHRLNVEKIVWAYRVMRALRV